MAFRTYLSMALLALLIAVAGCSGSNRLQHRSPEDAYQQGMQRFESGNYDEAIRFFRAVFSYGRANDWADDAQLQLARAYRNNRQYRLAATEYRRFGELYRNDERVPIAEYERAMSFFELSPRYQLDQTDTRQALSLFQLFQQVIGDRVNRRVVEQDSLADGKLIAKQLLQFRAKLDRHQ